ncbi:MAG: ribonuclease HII [Pseudomonadota bacterium]
MPDAEAEQALAAEVGGPVAGLDEAGRGPWAGPVVAAAAVVLDHNSLPEGLDDSKRLTPAKRQHLRHALEGVVSIGLGVVEAAEIDRLGIVAATDAAMLKALAALPAPPKAALVDGNRLPRGLALPGRALVGGDGRALVIAAASIAAKVARDALMAELGRLYPGYGFERHMGYGTPQHRAALARLGVAPPHRRSFRPIRAALEAEGGA